MNDMRIKIRTFTKFNSFQTSLAQCPPEPSDFVFTCDMKAHKWLEHNDTVKPFYDVETNLKDEHEWEDQTLIVEETRTKSFQKIYPNGEIAISSYHRRKDDSELGKKKMD
jgi:hypothetical protein